MSFTTADTPSRGGALVRGLTVLPGLVVLVLLRLVAALLWPFAWVCVLVLGRAPRWWRRFAGAVLVSAARQRAHAWLLTGRRSALAVVVPPPRPIRRRSALWLAVVALPLFVYRWVLGWFATLFAVAAWACRVFARRHPRRLRGLQWRVLALCGDVDAYALMLIPRRAALPEPDPRLRPGGRLDADHAALPPWTARTGWIAIAADVGCFMTVAAFFGAAIGFAQDSSDTAETWVELAADLALQGFSMWVALYIASSVAPVSVSQFGLHVLRPWRSLRSAVGLISTYAVIIAAVGGLASLFFLDRESDTGLIPDNAATAAVVCFVAYTTVIAPLFEEFFYRGLLFQSLRARRGTWWAAGVSSLWFALAHLDFNPVAVADRMLIGIGLCWLFARTGRLLPGMLAHSINNGVVVPLLVGWDWQIAIVIPASLALIMMVVGGVSRIPGRWRPVLA